MREQVFEVVYIDQHMQINYWQYFATKEQAQADVVLHKLQSAEVRATTVNFNCDGFMVVNASEDRANKAITATVTTLSKAKEWIEQNRKEHNRYIAIGYRFNRDKVMELIDEEVNL